jgi:outer membrane lipoprotein SlyB
MRRRLSAALIGAVVLTAGFALASCGSDEDASDTTETTATTETTQTTTTTTTTTTQPPPPPGPTEIRVRVVNGVAQGGIVRETVDQGDRVALIVTSDVADHVHVHGYDLFRDLVPGKRVRIAFRARLPGRFVVELEDRHAQIAELTVNP